MESPSLEQVGRLAQQPHEPSLSMYMPTFRAGRETQQNAIRFKNLLQQATQHFEAQGLTPPEIAALLEPGTALLEDDDFWQHQQEGLAAFLSPELFETFHLPFSVDELLVIRSTFYIKPMLPLFTNNGRYYILAFSQDDVRLFEATRDAVNQLDLPEDAPTSLSQALWADDPEKQLQFHTGATSSTGEGALQAAGVFHGHGAGDEDNKERIERYLNTLDAGLRPFLTHRPAPLVLAGVDYLLPMYRAVSEYPHILEEGITGSPEHLRPEELHAQAWPLAAPYFQQQAKSARQAYHNRASAGQASDDLAEVVAAAHYGRVDQLMLSTESEVWGSFDAQTGQVSISEGPEPSLTDVALVELAALQTLNNGGSIYALSQQEMPTDSPVAAVFRY